MGDFNARVGIRDEQANADDVGHDLVLGRFGNPQLNDNGRLLLDFCRQRNRRPLRVMSRMYQHDTYGTWQHNLTKLWHQIDRVLAKGSTAPFFWTLKQ